MLSAHIIRVCAIVAVFIVNSSAHKKYPMGSPRRDACPGEPLFLTPDIESGKIERAKQVALVEPFYGNITSYSGFLTVNKEYNSNMYFWFFPAEVNHDKAPLLIWLQGGPGASGVYTVFDQFGPYIIDQSNQLKKREIYWSQIFNVIYVDNPVGTGFSFTDNDNGYSINDAQIGENLYIFMKQFYQLFPEYKKNEFYIAGNSYGGKFVVALAQTIDENEKSLRENEKINLKGLAISSGFVDPFTAMERSDIFYQLGLIDFNFKLELEKYIKNIQSLLTQRKFGEALDYNVNVMRKTLFEKIGFDNLFNIRYNTFYYPFGSIDNFVNSNRTRQRLHVGNISFNTSEKVATTLRNDLMQSVKPWFENLVEKYRIMMYTGQLDLEIVYTTIVSFIRSLNWTGLEAYNQAERTKWNVDNELAGYMKTAGKLTDVLVRNAGHMSGLDQPKFIFELMKYFTNYSPN